MTNWLKCNCHEEQDYSLNPGRYVGIIIDEEDVSEEEFELKIKTLKRKYDSLTAQSLSFESSISQNLSRLF